MFSAPGIPLHGQSCRQAARKREGGLEGRERSSEAKKEEETIEGTSSESLRQAQD